MSRAGSVFKTLRGWSWLCAALALMPLADFAATVLGVERTARARLATGAFVCGTGYDVFLALAFALAAGAGVLVALLGSWSFVRLARPRAAARRREWLAMASAPVALPALYFAVMVLMTRIAAA